MITPYPTGLQSGRGARSHTYKFRGWASSGEKSSRGHATSTWELIADEYSLRHRTSAEQSKEHLVAPPSSKPRLSALTPDGVALEVALAAFHYTQDMVQALLAPAYAGARMHGRECAEDLCTRTHIYLDVRVLAAYAINGTGSPAAVANAWAALVPLWASVSGRGLDERELRVSGGDLDTPLGLVVCAASARELLAQDQPISAVQLGALAGLSATQIRVLSRKGDFMLLAGKAAPYEARRWLVARGVPGFECPLRPEPAQASTSAA